MGAVMLSLCKLLLPGPLLQPPEEMTGSSDDVVTWYQSRQSRANVMDITVADTYGTDMDDIIYNCLTEEVERRPWSWRVAWMLWEAESNVNALGLKKDDKFPSWVFG